MGGFRVNGCGATDHYKKIKSLGTHICPRCNKEAEFFLEEANFKVDIFFIPTVTLKSRYAIMCSKCKEGEFCSNQWAVNMINSKGTPSVIFESQAQPAAVAETYEQNVAQPIPETVTYTSPEPNVGQTVPKANNTAPSFFKCPHCGVTQLREGAFCSFCGKPAPGETNAAQDTVQSADADAQDEISVCLVCGNIQEAGKKFCSNCGNPMTAPAPTPAERVCPGCGAKVEDDAFFCMECGMKL